MGYAFMNRADDIIGGVNQHKQEKRSKGFMPLGDYRNYWNGGGMPPSGDPSGGGPSDGWGGGPIQGQYVPPQQGADPSVEMGKAGSGQMTQTPTGWDQQSPGVGEQYWNYQQNRFTDPGQASQWWGANQGQFQNAGQGEQYWNQVRGKFNQPTNSQSFFQDYEQNLPDFGSYYNRAKERSMGDINNQLASRGAYGSSVGVDQLSQSVTDLEAQRANREADYMLQQSNLGGQLASQADQANRLNTSLGGQLAAQAQGLGLQRLGQAGELALGVDQADLSRLMGGMESAGMAQGLRRDRTQDYIQNLFAPGAAMGGMMGQGFDQLIGGDQAGLDSVLALMLGLGKEAYNQDRQGIEQYKDDQGHMMNLFGSLMGGMLGM